MSQSDRDRDDRGQYAETVTPGDVLALFQNREDPFEPLTAREVADVLDCDPDVRPVASGVCSVVL